MEREDTFSSFFVLTPPAAQSLEQFVFITETSNITLDNVEQLTKAGCFVDMFYTDNYPA